MWRAHWKYCLTSWEMFLFIIPSFTSCLPLIIPSPVMLLFINQFCLFFVLSAHNTLLSSYTSNSSCIKRSLNVILPLPANTNGQRPSLVLTGLDDLGSAISIVTQASPVLTELYNWICVFWTLTEFCAWFSVGFNVSTECTGWWPQ